MTKVQQQNNQLTVYALNSLSPSIRCDVPVLRKLQKNQRN